MGRIMLLCPIILSPALIDLILVGGRGGDQTIETVVQYILILGEGG
jgi:hypothetical protein